MKLTFSGYASFDGHGHRMSFSRQRLRQNVTHFTDLLSLRKLFFRIMLISRARIEIASMYILYILIIATNILEIGKAYKKLW